MDNIIEMSYMPEKLTSKEQFQRQGGKNTQYLYTGL